MNEKHGFSFWVDFLYTLAIAFVLWEVNQQIILYTRRKYYSYLQFKKRILYTAIGITIATCLIITLLSLFYDVTDWWGYENILKNYLYNIFVALIYCIIVGGMYESILLSEMEKCRSSS